MLQSEADGSPRLFNSSNAKRYPIRISLSHCAGGVAIAFARKAAVGVDIETHRKPLQVEEAIARQLSEAEHLLVTPRSIWDCWSRKEALLKAMGTGLGALKDIPSLDQKGQSLLVDGRLWRVATLDSGPSFSLAYACEGAGRRVKHFVCRSWVAPLRRV
ncbi:4'-phosphopantetheinyl transferase family protein [Ramlibacter sp.]|uniref:4'-phosphopantetheinyl transferase family protein n=1 Tax=Ramlibacter sp. TaxID=1917967 RepID=UPI003D129548